MGVHKSPAIKHYFEKTETSPLHLTCNYMSHTRYEQLKRFIHISDPAGDELRPPGEKDWWFKLEPLASSFRAAAQQYYQPGPNLALHEFMICCFGRSHHTVKMPNKPIQQGTRSLHFVTPIRARGRSCGARTTQLSANRIVGLLSSTG